VVATRAFDTHGIIEQIAVNQSLAEIGVELFGWQLLRS